ncbi:MAG TPA: transposase [Verrucomicrobiae bacterium]|nr:transposase [Verrucomicrobiae bacterium]
MSELLHTTPKPDLKGRFVKHAYFTFHGFDGLVGHLSSGVAAVRQQVRMLSHHLGKLLSHLKSYMANAASEGWNPQIQSIKPNAVCLSSEVSLSTISGEPQTAGLAFSSLAKVQFYFLQYKIESIGNNPTISFGVP